MRVVVHYEDGSVEVDGQKAIPARRGPEAALEAQANPAHYQAEVLRLRDRVIALHAAHSEEAAASHPNLPAGQQNCQTCLVIGHVVAALGSDRVIDHAVLHAQLDQVA